MKPSTIRGIHSILSGAFAAAQRWEWTDRNPAESAKPPTAIRQTIPATSPEDVAKVIAEARRRSAALGLYLWLVVATGVRRGELCGLQVRDIHFDQGLIHVAFNYVVRGGQRVRKDTKTHQDRWLAIDPDTCTLIATYLDEIRAALAAVGVELADDAYLFSNDPAHARPWNPDWATHKVAGTARLVLQGTDIATAVTTCLHARNWADVVSDVPDGLSVRLDRRRLDVIVANLVGNAVRHGEALVTVRVSAGPGAHGRKELAVEVPDHGPGLSPDAIEHAFERFYEAETARARFEGSGLGLANRAAAFDEGDVAPSVVVAADAFAGADAAEAGFLVQAKAGAVVREDARLDGLDARRFGGRSKADVRA